jgi:hypothetical protein
VTLTYEDAVLAALEALADTPAQQVVPVGLIASSFRHQLEEELRAVQAGRMTPRSLAGSLSHQMVDSGHCDDSFSRALDGMYELQESVLGTMTLMARVTVRELREKGMGTREAAASLLGRYGLLVTAVGSQGSTRPTTMNVDGRQMIPAFSSRDLFDEWAVEAGQVGVTASPVQVRHLGQLAPGVDVVINPLNERTVLRNERPIDSPISGGEPRRRQKHSDQEVR